MGEDIIYLGNIIAIEENTVVVRLSIDLQNSKSLSNLYVLMNDGESQIVGEISNIKDENAYITIVGEMVNDKFVFGIIKKPSFAADIKLIDEESVEKIISTDGYVENRDLYIGKNPIYKDVDVRVNIDSFFSNHFAIFGSTGSGKSCSVARLFQNLFRKEDVVAYRASIFIFDAYGEYHSAFKSLNEKHPAINFKSYTTNLDYPNGEILKFPFWLLSVDDLALLLGVESTTQLPIIEKALKLVTVFAKDEEEVIKSKNDIISRAIMDILTSGDPAAQIRDQIFSILSNYNTRDLNLETKIVQPGYTRSLKQCLLIDSTGKIREMELINDFMRSYVREESDLLLPDGSFKYTLKDFADAFDFALISEGSLNNEKVYEELSTIKVRLHSLVNGTDSTYFDYPEYITKAGYIKKLLTAENGNKAQIINFNINYIDDRLAKTITKIYSKLLFDYSKSMRQRATLPFHIVLEEAHRYVQNDSDIKILGYNIFERITKEGRKYGVMLGMISQRPSELSETALSQCNNFLIFKMLHPRDVEYIRSMVPNITNDIIKRLRILQPGNCVAFGTGFKVPVVVKFDMPNPAPSSASCEISKMWFTDTKKRSE